VWGASAFRGAGQPDALRVDTEQRVHNQLAWARLARLLPSAHEADTATGVAASTDSGAGGGSGSVPSSQYASPSPSPSPSPSASRTSASTPPSSSPQSSGGAADSDGRSQASGDSACVSEATLLMPQSGDSAAGSTDRRMGAARAVGYGPGRPLQGLILTGWARFNHIMALCETLPAALPSLAACLSVHSMAVAFSAGSGDKHLPRLLACMMPDEWSDLAAASAGEHESLIRALAAHIEDRVADQAGRVAASHVSPRAISRPASTGALDLDALRLLHAAAETKTGMQGRLLWPAPCLLLSE
jgi:hypothetical protein